MPHFRLERQYLKKGVWPVAGVDEVGRGPLAGPVAAAAVILDPKRLPKGIDDSKKLSLAVREALYVDILASALAVSIGLVPAAEIDVINIRQASHLAMRRALRGLALLPSHALIDGNDAPADLVSPCQTIIKGDAISLSIAAASIVAKVTRDRLMTHAASHHPHWGFDQHMGYGTKLHLAALAKHGPCALHRMSFSPLRAFVPYR